jgi:RNA polymerase sigma-70 factor (ECF subfamily)
LLAHKPKWADLDDLLQDVALQVLRKGHQVHDPLAFPGWLRAVAINVARVAARRGPQAGWRGIRAALGFGAQDPSSENAPTPQSLELCEHARQILSLASQLDDDYREPLLLKAIEGLSYRQIGVVLGLPETTIETRITRARKQLRQLIVASDQSASRAPIVTEPTPARIPVGAKA